MLQKKAKKLSPAKAESITVRIDPKLRYALELLARNQRRNLSSVVEWAIQRAIDDPKDGLVAVGEHGEAVYLLPCLWSVEESDRFFLLAEFRPDLLSFEEGKLSNLILESDIYDYITESLKHLSTGEMIRKRREKMREYFDIFKKANNGEADKDALPKPPKSYYQSQRKGK
jgi:hypothetical protein